MPSIKDYLSDSLPQIYKKFSYLVFFVLEEVGKGTQVDIQKPPPQTLRRGFRIIGAPEALQVSAVGGR